MLPLPCQHSFRLSNARVRLIQGTAFQFGQTNELYQMRSSYSKVAAETPRSCSALAGTRGDLATVTKLPRTDSTVCWSEAISNLHDT